MDKEKNLKFAKVTYETICSALDARQWKYEKEEEKLLVHFGVNGDDIPMQFIIMVDADRQLIRLMSPLPFKMSEEKRMEGAVAVCAATYGMTDGNFDYDLSDGRIVYRMTQSFRESLIGEGLIQYMISCACAIMDAYNDRFLALEKGIISISDFLEKE